MKVDLELVKLCMQRNDIPLKKVAEVLNDVQQTVAEILPPEPAPRLKKQFCIIEREGSEIGWVVQMPEEESFRSCLRKISDAAHDFNMTPKGRRIPVKSIGEALEAVPARIMREHGVWVKTREAVYRVLTNNQLEESL